MAQLAAIPTVIANAANGCDAIPMDQRAERAAEEIVENKRGRERGGERRGQCRQCVQLVDKLPPRRMRP